MEKNELFKKVFIKSEADLPKENNPFLLAHFKKGNDTEEFTFGWYPYKQDMKDIWLRDIDWYLLPIEQEPLKDVKSAEEILKKNKLCPEDMSHYKIWDYVIEAMEEYRGQGIPEIADEEIEKWADQHSSFTGVGGIKNNNLAKQVSFIQGAQWYREQTRSKQ